MEASFDRLLDGFNNVFHVLSCCTRKWLYDHLVGFRKAPATDVLDESPAITVTGFLVCALFPGPDCGSFSFFS